MQNMLSNNLEQVEQPVGLAFFFIVVVVVVFFLITSCEITIVN